MGQEETKIEMPDDVLEKVQPEIDLEEPLVVRLLDGAWCGQKSVERLTGTKKELYSHYRRNRREIPHYIELFLTWMGSHSLNSVESLLNTPQGKSFLAEHAKHGGLRPPSPEQARAQIQKAKELREQQFKAMERWFSIEILEEAWAFGVERGWFTNPQDIEKLKEVWHKTKQIPRVGGELPKPKTTYKSPVVPKGILVPDRDVSGPKKSKS